MISTAFVLEDDLNLATILVRNLLEVFEEVHHFTYLHDLQAYRASVAECPALVWADLKLPGSTVPEVFGELREVRGCCPDAIIVVMTGMPDSSVRQQAKEAGADEVVTKPIQMSVLDMVRLIFVGAINAMQRGSSSSQRVLGSICSMVIRCMHTHLHAP